MKCILITKNNKQLFASLLPGDVYSQGRHLVFGAYDDEGYVLGAIVGSYLEYECSIDWLYVHSEARRCGVAAGLLECLIAAVNASWMCPVTARFEAASDNQLYEFFIAQEQMEMEYLFDRWYISPKALILSPILSKAEETARQFTALNFFECSGQRQRMILSLLSDLPNGYEVDDFKDMIRLVSSVAKDAAMLCPDATLVFDAANDSSSKLEGKFFPKGLKINMYEASAI